MTAARERRRVRARNAATFLYVPFGILHVLAPDKFLPIMPPAVPMKRQVVIATGVAEIFGGLGLLMPRTRRAASIGLAFYAIGVFPANVYHAVSRKHVPPIPDGWWYHGPRLALQPAFVWWALFAGGILHRRRDRGA